MIISEMISESFLDETQTKSSVSFTSNINDIKQRKGVNGCRIANVAVSQGINGGRPVRNSSTEVLPNVGITTLPGRKREFANIQSRYAYGKLAFKATKIAASNSPKHPTSSFQSTSVGLDTNSMNSATKKQHWNYSTKYNADFPIKKLPGKKKNYDHIRSPIAILRSKSFDSFPAIGDAEAFVNKYKLLMDTVLGSGRASTVYLGERLADGLKVAIKFVEKSKIPCNGWAFIHGNRVPFEYCALRQLAQCDGVNKILDAYEAFGDYLFVLELTEDSSTLGEFLLSRGPFDEPEARYFFRNLVQIVEKCRQMGIYHRDLKEMNILVDIKRNLPILIDFGSSALVEHSPYSYLESCGTPAYTTPELLMEPWRANDGMESAVYSLGAIFDNMVNGFRLFDCIPTKYITEECRHLIAKMLDPCPRKRPSSFKAILADPWMGM